MHPQTRISASHREFPPVPALLLLGVDVLLAERHGALHVLGVRDQLAEGVLVLLAVVLGAPEPVLGLGDLHRHVLQGRAHAHALTALLLQGVLALLQLHLTGKGKN